MVFLQSIEHPASIQAVKINDLFNHFQVAAAGMLALVTGLVIYICIRFRQRGKNDTPEGISNNVWLEAAMITGPLLILGYFFLKSIHTEKQIALPVPEGRVPDVIITGHQWWWEVSYPGTNVVSANEIHLPAGKHLLMEMRTADVIHDWWVPELGNKIDLIPGIKNYLWVDILRPGIFSGTCSEFCGIEHAWMRIRVVVDSPAVFGQWLASSEMNAATPQDSLSRRGAALFSSKSCGSCHRIRGTASVAGIGPDLTHLTSRSELLTGLMRNDEDNLLQWISNPQLIKPGAYMPDYKLAKDSLRAIAHYLAQLK